MTAEEGRRFSRPFFVSVQRYENHYANYAVQREAAMRRESGWPT